MQPLLLTKEECVWVMISRSFSSSLAIDRKYYYSIFFGYFTLSDCHYPYRLLPDPNLIAVYIPKWLIRFTLRQMLKTHDVQWFFHDEHAWCLKGYTITLTHRSGILSFPTFNK